MLHKGIQYTLNQKQAETRTNWNLEKKCEKQEKGQANL